VIFGSWAGLKRLAHRRAIQSDNKRVEDKMIISQKRTDSENVIRMLCDSYPRCFSEKQRRPLKQDITADIIKDPDFKVAPELTTAAVEWYESHISYSHAMSVAGSKRIDLDGREVGTMTEQEAISARQKITELMRSETNNARCRAPSRS
jgi:sRNA-binding protein